MSCLHPETNIISGVHPAKPLFGVVQRTELRMPNHLVTSIRAPPQTPLTLRLVPEVRRHMPVCHLYLTLQSHLSLELSAGVAMLCKQSVTSATIASAVHAVLVMALRWSGQHPDALIAMHI